MPVIVVTLEQVREAAKMLERGIREPRTLEEQWVNMVTLGSIFRAMLGAIPPEQRDMLFNIIDTNPDFPIDVPGIRDMVKTAPQSAESYTIIMQEPEGYKN